MTRPHVLPWASIVLFALTLLACGGDGAPRRGDPGGADAGGGGSGGGSDSGGGAAPAGFFLRADLDAARAVAMPGAAAVGAARRGLRIGAPRLRLQGGSPQPGDPLPSLFAVDDAGEVRPALDAPPDLYLPPVQFALRLPASDDVLVSFAQPVQSREVASDGTETFVDQGSLFHLHADGRTTRVIEDAGVVAVRNRDIFRAGLDEDFEVVEPYRIDPQGRILFVWSNEPHQSLVRYDAAAGALERLIEAPTGRRYFFRSFRLTSDGAFLFVLADDLGSHADDADFFQIALRRYSLDGSGDVVDLIPTPIERNTSIGGMQITDDGRTAFFHALSLPGYDGVVRADIGSDGAVAWTLLYDAVVDYAPVNYVGAHHEYTGGFFDKVFDDALGRYRLFWSDRWFVEQDRASGVLDADAILARAVPYFTTEVDFAFDAERGSAALAAFLAQEPYEWEAILGVPFTTPDPASHHSQHFLEAYFVRAGSSDAPQTLHGFMAAHSLETIEGWIRITDIYLDARGALWALVGSHWNDAARGFDRIRPVGLLDSAGRRALTVLESAAFAAAKPVAYRLDGALESLVYADHTPGAVPQDRGTHRLFRLDSSLMAEPEDLFVNVPGPVTVLDFSIGDRSAYFVGYDDAGPRGGIVELDTLSYTPLSDAVLLETIEEL